MQRFTVVLGFVGVGLVVGTASALLGIGGGVLMVPAIVYIWGRSMEIAIGTSLAVMIPSALAGVLRHHFSFGHVDFQLAGLLAVGAIVGAYAIGAPLAAHLDEAILKKIFGVLMIIVGFKMIGMGAWLGRLFASFV